MNTNEIVKKYSENTEDIEHSQRVCTLALLFFKKVKNIFLKLQNFDNPHDLEILANGAKLHDIGIYFEDMYGLPHHKAGAKYIYENKPDDVEEEDVPVISCLIRYHRKNFPQKHHEFYEKLLQVQKAKVNCLGAIIRLADAFDYLHLGLIEDFEIEYNKNINVLTIVLLQNIMLNRPLFEAIARKKEFFEKVFKTKVSIKGQYV